MADTTVKKNPSDKPKKPNIFVRIGRWFKSVGSELRKVSWPSFGKVLKQTGVVLTVVVIFLVVVLLFDLLLGFLFDLLAGGLGTTTESLGMLLRMITNKLGGL